MPRGQHPNSKKALRENQKPMNSERIAKASETKARKKSFREEFELELAAEIQDKAGNKSTVKNAITKTAVQKALKGDLRAIEFIRDTIGEKPAENIVLSEVDPLVIAEIEAMVYDTP